MRTPASATSSKVSSAAAGDFFRATEYQTSPRLTVVIHSSRDERAAEWIKSCTSLPALSPMTSAIHAQLSSTTNFAVLALTLRRALLFQASDKIDTLQSPADTAERLIELFHRPRQQYDSAALFQELHASAFFDAVLFSQCGRNHDL